MLPLAEIMTKHVVTTTPDMTLRQAAELFAMHHISGAPVVRGKKVVGVVSAADIIALAASERATPMESENEKDREGWSGALPDESEDPFRESVTPASYFTQLWSDPADVTGRLNNPNGAELDALDDYTVEEIMSRPLVVLSSRDDVLRAATTMEEKSIHRVIVVDGGELVGIVSTLDIVRAFAERTLVARR